MTNDPAANLPGPVASGWPRGLTTAIQVVNAHAAELKAAESGMHGGAKMSSAEKAPTATAVSSDFSVDEWLLVENAGFEPCGLLAGAAVFHIGLVGSWLNAGNVELTALTDALLGARERAAANLRAEAARTGADGVVGVRLTIEAFTGKSHLARVIAVGTGVRQRARTAAQQTEPNTPFLSALSGQEFSVLIRCGYVPVALAMGVCVYHVARQGPRAWSRNVMRNVELTGYSEALYDARERAMGRLQAEALADGADGVVGVTTSELSHVWGSRVIEFFSIGTAIRVATEHNDLEPRCVLPVSDALILTDPAAVTGGADTGQTT